MKATFTGDCSPDPACEVFGLSFPPNEAVDVSSLDQAQQDLLVANPAFTTDSGKSKGANADAPAAA